VRYSGPTRYKPHVLGDVQAALVALQRAGFKATALPDVVTVQETRGQRRIKGTWCTQYNGVWGQAWHFYSGRGRSRVELVQAPDGRDNPDWRHSIRHESMHATMSANGIAVNNYDEQHHLMKTKLKGWY
jgi:hypothetical protein